MRKTYASTLVPAYGRDYKSKKTVQADLDADRDFIISNIQDRYDGKPCNASDLKRDGCSHVMIRYARLTKIAEFKLPAIVTRPQSTPNNSLLRPARELRDD